MQCQIFSYINSCLDIQIGTAHTRPHNNTFTIVVEENGHNPNHSYYDIQ